MTIQSDFRELDRALKQFRREIKKDITQRSIGWILLLVFGYALLIWF